jgi:hypothetical protein
VTFQPEAQPETPATLCDLSPEWIAELAAKEATWPENEPEGWS